MSGYLYPKKVTQVMNKKSKKSFVSTHKSKETVIPTISTTPSVPDQIKITDEEASKITMADQEKLQARINLADLEVYLNELQEKKVELLSLVRSKSDDFMKVVRDIAIVNGIDPDGKKDDSKWNLNTNEMTFYRVK